MGFLGATKRPPSMDGENPYGFPLRLHEATLPFLMSLSAVSRPLSFLELSLEDNSPMLAHAPFVFPHSHLPLDLLLKRLGQC